MDFTILHFAIHIVWRANVICTCRKSGIARKTTVAYPELRLLRVHRSYAVNIEHIDMVYNDSIIMQNKKRIPIGRDYHDSVPRNLVLIDKRDRSVPGDIDDSDKLKRTTTKKKRKYITPSISIIHEGCERHIQIMKEIEKQRKIEASETSRLNSHKE